MLKIKNNVATRDPIPDFLRGLSADTLLDLTWTDPQLGVQTSAWWPEADASPALAQYERYGAETLTLNPASKTVTVTRAVVAWSAPEIAADLANKRESRWEAIKAYRDNLSESGGYKVVVSGTPKWFHSDAKSKTQQLGLVIAGAGIPPIPWKTMDGSFVTMSQTLAGQIFQAALGQDQALFTRAEQHRAAMEASADPAAYDFSGGWPATFGG